MSVWHVRVEGDLQARWLLKLLEGAGWETSAELAGNGEWCVTAKDALDRTVVADRGTLVKACSRVFGACMLADSSAVSAEGKA